MLKIFFAFIPLLSISRSTKSKKTAAMISPTARTPEALSPTSLQASDSEQAPYQHHYRHAYLSAGRPGL